MSNQACIQENWDAIKDKLRGKWKELTEDDLDASKQDLHQLIQTIQRKTGEATESVENFFKQVISNGSAEFLQVGESIRGEARKANDSMRNTYSEVEEAVRNRPASSIAMGIAIGVLTGLTLSWILRRK